MEWEAGVYSFPWGHWGEYTKTIVLKSIQESRVLQTWMWDQRLNHSRIFGRVGNMDLGRLESKSGGMKVITQNSDPQHPLLARQPEGDGGREVVVGISILSQCKELYCLQRLSFPLRNAHFWIVIEHVDSSFCFARYRLLEWK